MVIAMGVLAASERWVCFCFVARRLFPPHESSTHAQHEAENGRKLGQRNAAQGAVGMSRCVLGNKSPGWGERLLQDSGTTTPVRIRLRLGNRIIKKSFRNPLPDPGSKEILCQTPIIKKSSVVHQ